MAEKRKPVYTIMLRKQGKNKHIKIEFFRGTDWNKSHRLFRMRVKGKWWPNNEFKLFYKSHIRNILFRSIDI